MSYVLTRALNICGQELKRQRRIDPNGNVFFYCSLEGILQQLKYNDDALLYKGQICAIPLKRDPIDSDEKITAEEFLAIFRGENLFQTDWGIIIPQSTSQYYEGIDFHGLSEYSPWPIMYCSQTNK